MQHDKYDVNPKANCRHLGEGADTGAAAQVDLAGQGGGADIVPVGVHGAHLLEGGGLHQVVPLGQFDLAGLCEWS